MLDILVSCSGNDSFGLSSITEIESRCKRKLSYVNAYAQELNKEITAFQNN
jgi:hypothetical protein